MKKVLSAGNIITCLSCIFGLIGLIIYAVNVNSEGFFRGNRVAAVVTFGVIAMIAAVVVILLTILPVKGGAAKVVDLLVMVCKVLVPVMLMIAAMTLLANRVAGFGYIFGANEDVRAEVATAENIASAMVAMVAIGFDYVAAIAGIVAAFFLPKRED